ncbi:MAG: mandelate racemase/muconate lactonizing enzyme family protein [Planctomycetia bacterium]|nr:mandelate racemase/muconate lactonizing enzyme family protein [Planctomycetia bacterium]
MKIEAVDFFYLSMPEVRDIGDGSQDALLVRVSGGGLVGWGECEAAPLVSIAAWNCPMSHSACKPVSASVLGQEVNSPNDIRRINALVRAHSLDLLQADHTLSGVDVALWDLLGKRLEAPVYRLLSHDRATPKSAYASVLFGDTPHQTFEKAHTSRQAGYRAVKFGWGPFGRGSVNDDTEQLHAAREGLGEDGILLVDAGTVWGDDVEQARLRLPALQACRALWLEEPFTSGALESYRKLAAEAQPIGLRLAGGEGCHNFDQAKNMIDYAGLGFVQIDTGRIGGITSAYQVADYARAKGVQFVNHTFTTHLALSASLQPFAGSMADSLCEYPAEPSSLARDLDGGALQPDSNGDIRIPESPGLGVEPNLAAIRKYLVDAEIRVGNRVIYRSPEVPE